MLENKTTHKHNENSYIKKTHKHNIQMKQHIRSAPNYIILEFPAPLGHQPLSLRHGL